MTEDQNRNGQSVVLPVSQRRYRYMQRECSALALIILALGFSSDPMHAAQLGSDSRDNAGAGAGSSAGSANSKSDDSKSKPSHPGGQRRQLDVRYRGHGYRLYVGRPFAGSGDRLAQCRFSPTQSGTISFSTSSCWCIRSIDEGVAGGSTEIAVALVKRAYTPARAAIFRLQTLGMCLRGRAAVAARTIMHLACNPP